MDNLTLTLSPELLEALADQIADKVAARTVPAPEPYMDSLAAAEYLGFRGREPQKHMSELARSSRIPVARDGQRLLFRASDLDAYVASSRSRSS